MEAIIAIGIAVVVGSMLVVIILNSSGIFYKESSTLEQGLNINDALSKIRQSVKESSGVASSYTLSGITYTSSSQQLVLKLPSINSSGNTISNTFDYFVFFKDKSYLRFKTFPDAASTRKAQEQIFSNSVDSLSFIYLDSSNPPKEVTPTVATKVRVSLTLKQKSGANFETNSGGTEANLRND